MTTSPILDRVSCPADMKVLSDVELGLLAGEVRAEVVDVVSQTGGASGVILGGGGTDGGDPCGVQRTGG